MMGIKALKYFSIFFLVLSCKLGFAQQYISVLDDVNKWAVFSVEFGVENERSYFGNSGYFTSQDTIIDSLDYKWIIPDNSFNYIFNDTLKYFLREDTAAKQIFIRYNDTLGEFLIYDFNLLAGDSILLDFKSTYFSNGFFKVDSISSLTSLVGIRKTWHLSNNINQKIVWIEGIGSIYGPVYTGNIFCDFCVMTDCYNQFATNLFLTCAFKDTMQIYQNDVCAIPPVWMAIPYNSCIYYNAGGINEKRNELNMKISPNPNNGIAYLKLNNLVNFEHIDLIIYNAMGQIVHKLSIAGAEIKNEIKIDLTNHSAGIYSIFDGNGNYVRFSKN